MAPVSTSELDSASRGATGAARRRRAAAALAFYVLATLLVAAPLPARVLDTVPRAVRPDTWLNVWALAWTSEHMVTDPAGLFDANVFYPRRRTLAYSDHFIGQALLAAPAWWATGNAVFTYNVAWYLALILTGWTGYLWVRRLLGDRAGAEAGALVAGAVCLLVPGKRTAFGHLQVVSLQAVPLALLAAHTLMRRPGPRRAAGLAAAVAWAGLCSWYTAAYVGLLLPLVGIAGLVFTVEQGRRLRAATWGAAGLGAAMIVLVPVALPYVQVQAELGIERPLAELTATSLRPVDWVASWSWLHHGLMSEGSGAGGHFPGWTAVILAAVGLSIAVRRRQAWPLIYGLLALLFGVFSLGPELPSRGGAWSLPYGWLYSHVPGFTALRNPYRAAFVAALLLAPLVGVGTAALLRTVRLHGPEPEGRRATVAGLLALFLAGLHLLEAWPGPQQTASLPPAPAPAHRWLAAGDGAAALEWPLPRPPDLNARYQLGTVGAWTRLANGHSGLYPPEFFDLYEVGEPLPSSVLLARIKELYPVDWIIVHYDRLAEGAAGRRAVAAAPDLTPAWSDDATVVYRLSRGARAGWLRRRHRREELSRTLELRLPADPGRCTPRLALDGEGVRVTPSPWRQGRVLLELALPTDLPELVDLEVWFTVAPSPSPVALEASAEAAEGATVRLNGWPVARGRVAMARLRGADGRLEATRSSAPADATDAVRTLMEDSAPGDWIAIAATEDPSGDALLVERLRLLLDAAGGEVPAGPLQPAAEAYALVGRMGTPAGSGVESTGHGEALARVPGSSADCLRGPVTDLRFVR